MLMLVVLIVASTRSKVSLCWLYTCIGYSTTKSGIYTMSAKSQWLALVVVSIHNGWDIDKPTELSCTCGVSI